jgi:hypothetical protein
LLSVSVVGIQTVLYCPMTSPSAFVLVEIKTVSNRPVELKCSCIINLQIACMFGCTGEVVVEGDGEEVVVAVVVGGVVPVG